MNYKSLLLILLIVVLVVVLAYNRRELFESENNFCDGENDVKYVIFYPKSADKVRANAKAIACNVRQYDTDTENTTTENTTTGMFVFRSAEMSNIAVEMGQPFELNLMCKIKGNGPVFTGDNWKVVAESDEIILQVENKAFKIPRSSSESSIELSYDSFSDNLVMLRVDGDDSTVKEVNAETALSFSRFDIGKADSNYFNGNIGNIVVLDSKLVKGETPATPQATLLGTQTTQTTQDTGNDTNDSDDDFDAILQFIMDLEAFTNYSDSNTSNTEHFQGNMLQPTNFNTVKIKVGDDNELSFLKNKMVQSKGEFDAAIENNESNAVKLSKALITKSYEFIIKPLTLKMNEFNNYTISKLEVPTINCREDEVLKACMYFNDEQALIRYKFTYNPVDGMVSVKSQMEKFITNALNANLVKNYFNNSPNKMDILNNIKEEINESFTQLKNRFSDAFFIYFELDFNVSTDNYNFYLRSVENTSPDVYMGEETPATNTPAATTPVATTPAATTPPGELYPPETPPRLLNCSFNAHGDKEIGCVKTCLDNTNINNCDPMACINKCEKCEDMSLCRWLQDRTQYQESQSCQFDANIDNTTQTEYDCIQLCNKSENVNCSQNVCKNLCQRCSNEENCPWVREEREYSADIQNIDYPSAPIVSGIPGDRKITLKWRVNSKGGSDIEKFIFMVFKTNDHNVGMRVEIAHNTVENNSGLYTHTIETLENNVNYTTSIAAVNKRGLSAMSKPLVLKPFVYDEEVIVDNTLNTSNIIQMERDRLVDEIMTKIENKNYNDLSNEIAEVSKIEESLQESRDKKTDLFSQLKKIGKVVLSA